MSISMLQLMPSRVAEVPLRACTYLQHVQSFSVTLTVGAVAEDSYAQTYSVWQMTEIIDDYLSQECCDSSINPQHSHLLPVLDRQANQT